MKLSEIFDTVLKFQSRWDYDNSYSNDTYTKTGWASDVEVIVYVEYIVQTTLALVEARISFGIRTEQQAEDGEPFLFDIGSIDTKKVPQIISGVVNVIQAGLPKPYDFLSAIAKDAVASRMKLYLAITTRLAPRFNMVTFSTVIPHVGGIVVMAPPGDIESIRKVIT